MTKAELVAKFSQPDYANQCFQGSRIIWEATKIEVQLYGGRSKEKG